jgi:peptidoglycan/LPS O-acetylase OafA/YrhL
MVLSNRRAILSYLANHLSGHTQPQNECLIVTTFLAATFFKVIAHLNYNNSFIDMLPFSQFDLFMIGGLLTTKQDLLVSKIKTTSTIKLLIYIVFILILLLLAENFLMSNISIGLLSFFLILITYSDNWFVRLLDFKQLVFLGKISYGLYLYHNFIPLIERNLVGAETRNVYFSAILPNYNSSVYHLSIQIILLVLISLLSWYLLEKRFLKLKITKY